MIKHLKNQKGIALVMALVISAIALAIMSALVYMVTTSTQISGMQKRYKTAIEAGTGGEGVIFEYIGQRGNVSELESGMGLIVNSSSTCMEDKLGKSTGDWDASCGKDVSIDINNTSTYDMKFQLGDFRVYSKIVNTIEGNSGAGNTGLKKSGVVAANSGEVEVQNKPYIYTIELDVRNIRDTNERARLSVLYQY